MAPVTPVTDKSVPLPTGVHGKKPAERLAPTQGQNQGSNSQEKSPLQKNIDTGRMWTSGISCAFGALSFVLASILKSQNEIVDKIALYSSKTALIINAFGGFLKQSGKKETSGSVAFGLDFFISIFANEEELYQWRGFASGLDQAPSLLENVADNPKIKEEYKLNDGNEEVFYEHHESFADSAKKIGSALKVTVQDIFEEFKNNKSDGKNAFKNLNNMLVDRKHGKHSAEKNLLLSGLGMISGAFLGTVLGFKKLGSTIRDIFGLYGDLAVYDAGWNCTDASKKKDYFRSGMLYTVGSVLDLIYRWTKLPNLNLSAIGADRLGAYYYVKAVGNNGKKKAENKVTNPNHNNGNSSNPVLQPT